MTNTASYSRTRKQVPLATQIETIYIYVCATHTGILYASCKIGTWAAAPERSSKNAGCPYILCEHGVDDLLRPSLGTDDRHIVYRQYGVQCGSRSGSSWLCQIGGGARAQKKMCRTIASNLFCCVAVLTMWERMVRSSSFIVRLNCKELKKMGTKKIPIDLIPDGFEKTVIDGNN